METFNINSFASELLLIAAFIATVGGAIAVIKKALRETKASKHDEIIKDHTEQIGKINERVSVLESTNRRQDRFTSAMCSAMLALLDHNINGNSIDKLKEAKEELREFLINRG